MERTPEEYIEYIDFEGKVKKEKKEMMNWAVHNILQWQNFIDNRDKCEFAWKTPGDTPDDWQKWWVQILTYEKFIWFEKYGNEEWRKKEYIPADENK